jgi:hypothetical protein
MEVSHCALAHPNSDLGFVSTIRVTLKGSYSSRYRTVVGSVGPMREFPKGIRGVMPIGRVKTEFILSRYQDHP